MQNMQNKTNSSTKFYIIFEGLMVPIKFYNIQGGVLRSCVNSFEDHIEVISRFCVSQTKTLTSILSAIATSIDMYKSRVYNRFDMFYL